MYSSESNGRKTFTSLKYAIQPIWWSDQDETDPKTWISDTEDNVNVLEEVKKLYTDMSWGSFDFSWFFLPQKKITVSSEDPTWDDNTEYLAQELIESEGYVKGVDFDGVMVLYNPSQKGTFGSYGGWGGLHGKHGFIENMNEKILKLE